MDVAEIISDLEARAKAADLSIKEACELAGFHNATFYRWKRGDYLPSTRLLSKLDKVLPPKVPA